MHRKLIKFVCFVFSFFAACHILVEASTPFYSLSNYGAKRNCTLTSMTPSVITLRAINIGAEHEPANYDASSFSDILSDSLTLK